MPNNWLLNLSEVVAAATGGIFVVLLLSGLLSALLTLGLLELFFRARIQRGVLDRYFASDVQGRPSDGEFRGFLMERYGSDSPAASAYTLGEIGWNARLFPELTKMQAQTFFQLHYRQLCGQLAAVISGESLRADRRTFRTPLTDVLAFVATRRSSVSGPPQHTEDTELVDRYYQELALRQVDVIQAELGGQINRSIYGWTIFAWMIPYAVVLATAWVTYPDLTGADWPRFVEQTARTCGLLVVAVIAASLLAIGTAVFSGVAYTWLDRGFAAK